MARSSCGSSGLWRHTEQQRTLRDQLPSLSVPISKTNDHVILSCYYQPRTQKNKTFWLILNDCLQRNLFNSSVNRPALAPLPCSSERKSTLLSLFFCVSLTVAVLLLDATWLNDLPSGLQPGQTGAPHGCASAGSRGGWNHPCAHLTWFVWILKMEGALYGIFQCLLQWNKGSQSVKLKLQRHLLD